MAITKAINLNLGQVPVDIQDAALYSELLDIHNALEILAGRGSNTTTAFDDFIAKYLTVTAVTGNYNILESDNLILVAAAASNSLIFLPSASGLTGWEFTIKCIDNTYSVTVFAPGVEELDGSTAGIELTLYDSITVKSDGTNWWVI